MVKLKTPPVVAVINESTVLPDSYVSMIVPILATQYTHIADPAAWGPAVPVGLQVEGLSKTEYLNTKTPVWALIILDDADQAGALGYHDYITKIGLPIGKVFAHTTQQANANVDVTMSHEFLEMVIDPKINLTKKYLNNYWAEEGGDPVEADQYGYTINGHTVSDFILPSWFKAAKAAKYDWCGHLTTHHQLLPGGYASYADSRGQWHQLYAQRPGMQASSRPGTSGRSAVRFAR